MSGPRFVRFYPSDWRSGCIGLTLEQEGLYIRVCAYIYETNRRVPIDDSQAAKIMGAHTNAYRKIRDQLAALGKLKRRADGWTVDRAEKELALASHQAWVAPGPADQDAGRETGPDTLGDTPPNTPPDTRGDTHGDTPLVLNTPLDTPLDTPLVFSKYANEINGSLKSQREEKRSAEVPPTPQTGGEDDRDALHAQVKVGQGSLPAVQIVEDRIVLHNGTRQMWLEQFGGDGVALDLALIEARGRVQPNSRSHSLQVQVERSLAAMARDKRDRDQRYAKAVTSKPARPPPASSKRTLADALRDARARESESA